MRPLKKLSIFALAFLIIEQTSSFMLPFVRGEIFETASVSTQAVEEESKEKDWSQVDWDKTVVLASDLEDYLRRRDELAAERKSAELRTLTPVSHALFEEASLEAYAVPEEVKYLVRLYREKREALLLSGKSYDIAAQKEALRESIRLVLHLPELSQKTVVEETTQGPVLDIRTSPQLPVERTIAVPPAKPLPVSIEYPTRSDDFTPLYRITLPGIVESTVHQNSEKGVESETSTPSGALLPTRENGFLSFLKSIFRIEKVSAAVPSPLISYYQGIEKKPMDYALYYLSQQQNPDGSFGTFNTYEVTAQAVLMLNEVRRTASDQYQSALNYLLTTTPKTNREKALKARILFGMNQAFQPLLDEIIAVKNRDGGYGLDAFYASDPLTTMEVALAFHVTGYQPNDVAIEALRFSLNAIPEDGAMRFTSTGDPSSYLINHTVQYLLPFKAFTIKNEQGQSIKVQDKINALLSYLSKIQGTQDIIDDLMTIRTLRLYETEPEKTLALSKESIARQSLDGSFGSSALTTIIAFRALKQPDAVLTNLVSVGSLENKSKAIFKMTIKNNGYAPIKNMSLYRFVDNYYVSICFFVEANTVLYPGDTAIFTLELNDTFNLLGSAEFKFYLEVKDDLNANDNWVVQKFTFAVAADGTPALPLYYIGQKHNVAINGQPTVNVRWIHRNDPNRSSYVLMWRKKGELNWNYFPVDNGWNGAFFSGGWLEGETYDITVGVFHQDSKTVTYSNDATEVRVSTDPNLYIGNATGRVTDNDDIFPNAPVLGYNLAAQAGSDGMFNMQNIQNGGTAAWVDTRPFEKIATRFFVPVSGTTTSVRVFSRLKEDTIVPVLHDVSILFNNNFIVKNQKEVIVQAVASDNIAIKEGDFYLWDPKEQIWIFLGTAQASNFSSVEMPWYIPAELLGNDFKIKAVVRDYRGNEASFKQWGPFTIIDSTPPQFTITIPNGREIWPLNGTSTIRWNTTAINGVDRVNLQAVYPYATAYIGGNLPNTDSYDWFIRNSSSYAGDSVKVKVSGFDKGNFEYSFDESDEPFEIVDKSPKPADPWGYPQLLKTPSTEVSGDIVLSNLQLAADRNGDLHLVYRVTTDVPGVTTERIYYRKYAAGAWSSEEKIYEKLWQRDLNPMNYQPLLIKKIQLDSRNRPHLLLELNPVGPCEAMNRREIYYTSFDGVKWSAPENISNNATESVHADFTIDNNDTLYAVWEDGINWDQNCQIIGKRKIHYRTKVVNNAWGALEELAANENPAWPRVAVVKDTIHLIYHSGAALAGQHMKRAFGAWSTPSDMFKGFDDSPELVADPNGILHYVFREFYQDPKTGRSRNRISYLSYDGATWSSLIEISPAQDGYSTQRPRLVLGEGALPHVVFEAIENQIGLRAMWVMKKNGVWIPAQAVSPVTYNIYPENTALSFSPSAHLVLLWNSLYSFRPTIFLNTANP